MSWSWVLTAVLLLPASVGADGPGFHDELLDRMVGTWVMTGTIGGDEITHDITAEWVLDHWYLRFTEVAREKNEEGEPAYEAIVFIGWDEPSSRYACMWLAVTAGSGLNEIFGYAEPTKDQLPFVFDAGDETFFHTTFSYDREVDVWHWNIDAIRSGVTSNFAKVSLVKP